MAKLLLKDMDYNELQQFLETMNCKSFRAKQLFNWMYKQQVDNFTDMTNLSQDLRHKLEKSALLYGLTLDTDKLFVSSEDGTIKFLAITDNNIGIETTVMKYNFGNTVCISSQAGCNMNCAFCASTKGGKQRDLTPGEMVDQVILANKILGDGEKISNIVVMGSGEPLENYDNLLKFLQIANDSRGLNIGMRHITVSTCGLVSEINYLAEERMQINLAISLHAPNDKLRDQLVPVNKRYPIDDLMEACQKYFSYTGRRISFEYVLIDNVNDNIQFARELSDLLAKLDMPVHVNIIPYNTVEEAKMCSPAQDTISKFVSELTASNITVTVRQERGADIDGACGQLRYKRMR